MIDKNAEKRGLVAPLALAAGVATALAAPAPAGAKVLRVVAQVDEACAGGASAVTVTSGGLANIIRVIGGAG